MAELAVEEHGNGLKGSVVSPGRKIHRERQLAAVELAFQETGVPPAVVFEHDGREVDAFRLDAALGQSTSALVQAGCQGEGNVSHGLRMVDCVRERRCARASSITRVPT